MTELDISGNIDADLFASATAEEVEETLQDKISKAITKQIMVNLDKMAFIDLQLDEETNKFHYEASIVLCSKQDIITNAQLMAHKLAEYDLTQEEILDILETQTQENEGF